MRSLIIIGFAVGIPLAGCTSTNGVEGESTTSHAAEPAQPHTHGDGTQARMMAETCPMQLSGTTVAATDVTGGIGLSFVTTTGDVADLRQRVLRMAEAHNQSGGHAKMGTHGTHAGDVHGGGGMTGGGMTGGGMTGGGMTGDGMTGGGMTGGGMTGGGMTGDGMTGGGMTGDGMTGGGMTGDEMTGGEMTGGEMTGGEMTGGEMNMPAAIASAKEMEGGALLILQPKDHAELESLREHVRMMARRMAQGECPMMSQVSVGERAPGTSDDGMTPPPGAP